MSRGQRAVADRLHSAAIHLLRTLREADDESRYSSAKLSALSVLVFAGPRTVGELARTERVTAPSMSVLVRDMEADGLVRRRRDQDDRRVVHLRATARGRRELERSRERRIDLLLRLLGPLSPDKQRTLSEAAELIEHSAATWGAQP